MPATTPTPVFDHPADTLLPEIGRVTHHLQQEVVDAGDRTVLPWQEFTATVITAGQQRSADRYFRALARITGHRRAGLPELLDLIAEGRLADLTDELFTDTTWRDAETRFTAPMTMLLSLAAVRSGAATWQHSWSEAASLVDAGGQPIHLEAIAGLAITPATLPEARTRLAQLGISVERTTVVEDTVDGRGACVVTAVSDVNIDGANHDVIVLNRGFVLVPVPAKVPDWGRDRLGRIIGSATPAELVERNRFLPFEEIAGVTFAKRIPARVRLATRGGTTITMNEGWTSAPLGEPGSTAFVEILERLA